jgi:hypothetical protein
MLSRSQARGHATKTARSRLRWQKARDISAAGGTKADAAAATGLSLEGLNTLLRKHVGNQQWPIQESK